jgi:HEAT repeat protein
MSEGLPEEKSRPVTLLVQLVVIPLAVVLFCVALGGLFMWLTAERKDFGDYLSALRASSGQQRSRQAQYLLNYIQESKRWQGIFDVTAQISADRDQFLARYPHAVAGLTQIFDESKDQDPKTRRYLALVLGLLGDKEAVPALRRGLDDADADTVKNCVWALGRLADHGSASRVIELTRHDEPAVRMIAVYVLGSLQHPQAGRVLAAALNDPDQLVRWNAAFGLASKGDPAGRAVLLELLDKQFVDRATETTVQNRQRYRVAAVVWLSKLDGEAAIPVLERVSAEDADYRVRNAAIQQLNRLKGKGRNL